MSIATRLEAIRRNLPPDVQLVAVSKYHSEGEIMEAYAHGQRDFGENLPQELHRKALNLPTDIRWHLIGHLQRNKVRLIVPHVSLIQSVDSLRLLRTINDCALSVGRSIDYLLQIHIAQEQTKFGLTPTECLALLSSPEWRDLTCVRLRGLMCIATNTSDTTLLSSEFRQMQTLFNTIHSSLLTPPPLQGEDGRGLLTPHSSLLTPHSSFNLRSWGMSNDYTLATAYGSNMVRIGTAIFGPRPSK